MISRKNIKGKLGPRAITKKNPYLKPDGGIDLIERFPGIDFIPYEKRRLKNQKRDD